MPTSIKSGTGAPVQRWRKAGLAAILLCAMPQAWAEPAFARLYQQQYGYRPGCHACHKDGGGTPINAYGEAFKKAGRDLAAFERIAAADADGDGAGNAAEAAAKANPGSKASTPQAPGDWLQAASLVPREVQAQFPGIRTYLPRDALLTPRDIERARQLGAELDVSDENTIYIAVADQKPVGTALIFPARYRDQTFFLLLTTDRQLRIRSVQPLHTGQVPAAGESDLYGQFKGVPVDQLPQPQGEDLQAAVTRAVKKAGTLLYVRLKNA